jgi:ADP-heptose:LPS heptosyltransferase
MAQTWPPKKWKQLLVGAVDFAGRPVARAFRTSSPAPIPASPRILVVELWQLGDVVLVTPFLSALRQCFPLAKVTLMGKPHAETLLRGTSLVDDFVIAELPWTRSERKYRLADYDRRALRDLIRTLRRRRFDLVFDARMDIRSNALVALTRAARRVGFRHGGGHWLLTDAIAVDPGANHKVVDWLSLLRGIGCEVPVVPQCTLSTLPNERAAAVALLRQHFGSVNRPIALHPGASHAGKRWPLSHFIALARELVGAGHQVVALEDPSGYGKELGMTPGVVPVRTDLRGMMAVIERCATLVCNDSGPMHIAAGLRVPTVAIFERGEPRWFGPVGDGHVVLAGERSGVDVSAAPIDRSPTNPVPVERVKQAVLSQFERHRREA